MSRNEILDELWKNNGFLFGGFVYKHTLRNEETADIDMAVPSKYFYKMIHKLTKEYGCKSFEWNWHAKLECGTDIYDVFTKSYAKMILSDDKSGIFQVVLTKKGYAYLDDDRTFCYDKKISQAISNIKEKLINCNHKFRREKHQQYFSSWQCL